MSLDQSSDMSHLALDVDSDTLPHYPAHIYPWMRALVVFGFLSFFASVTLFALLTYRLIRWQIKSRRANQFAVLIFNLLLADIQQSLAFLLNVEWLRLDSLVVGTPICFAQGWLVSTGDLASGVWCFTIGLHTLANVVFDYRLRPRCFYLTIFALWAFIYGVSAIGVGMYGSDVYVRSGVWCWISHDLKDLRLWTHYIFIFVFEFGNVLVYAVIYAMLVRRLGSGYYTDDEAKRIKAISNLMVAYPIVYVVCTLPLASARMAAMSNKPPSLTRLCLAGVMITSNGWLDVLLYTLTRRIMIFSDEPPPDTDGIDTFSAFWAESKIRFGNASKIEAISHRRFPVSQGHDNHWKVLGRDTLSLPFNAKNESMDVVCDLEMGRREIEVLTTTHVVSEPAQQADYKAMEEEARKNRPPTPMRRYSEDSADMQGLELAHIPND